MKAFVFTLDAIFSLIFAATAISALVYVSYSGYSPPTAQSSEVASLGSALASAGMQGLSQASPLYGAGTSGTWPQYGGSEGYSFGAPYGPTGPYLLFSYAASSPANIIPAVVVSNGYVAFAAGNQLYEVNSSTGLPVNNYPIKIGSNVVSSPVYYRNFLIYANSIGYVSAVSASNGLAQIWKMSLGTGRVTTPLQVDEGYVVFGFNSPNLANSIYFVDPSNGSVVENDPSAGNGPMISWIAHRKGVYYIGAATGKPFNSLVRNEYANVSFYPSNGFASYGNFSVVDNRGTAAMYANLTAYYNKGLGMLNLTSIPYGYAHAANFNVPSAIFNTTPSIGGNTTYLLDNGIYFEALRQGGLLFNVILPGNPTFLYNYSDIALANGNAYFSQGNTLYAFGTGGFLQQNSSVLAALGDLYLTGRGGLADYILYNTYGSGNIGIYINGSYGPSLHIARFDGYDSYVAVPNSIALDSPTTMSVCAWIYPYSVGNWEMVVVKSDGTINGQFELRLTPSNTLQFATDTTGGGYQGATFPSAIVPNSWYHVCGVNNGASIYSYLNGIASSPTTMGGNINIQSVPLTIGDRASGGSFYFNGIIADVQLYNSVLSQGRISQIYSGGMYSAPPNLTGLVGWWPLLGDGNDYGGGGRVGFPNNVIYTSSNTIPASLSRAAEIGRSSIPLQLTNNGVSNIFNVSVVVWTS